MCGLCQCVLQAKVIKGTTYPVKDHARIYVCVIVWKGYRFVCTQYNINSYYDLTIKAKCVCQAIFSCSKKMESACTCTYVHMYNIGFFLTGGNNINYIK